ncbi:MAG: hypothetical protein JXR48_17410 [Candidatus Delongbacteria bacterium]|nr:hypothetical protein [Candidatus Delongbacteria bacterium]MBN2836738.1 hypothetical protein [Candidatus Delongbacteria bacterium]
MNKTEILDYLYGLQFTGIKLGLMNIRNLLNYCKIDYNKLKYIHIAGTNGKGSTANMLNQIYVMSGYKTALFTSPHITDFNERIKVNNQMISDDDLARLTLELKEGIDLFKCTFFEATTAIAIKYYIEKKVDIVLFEVGLGGRLDSTNIVTPLASLITGIDFDHMGMLGYSLIEIAREKAGIIKNKVPVIYNDNRKYIRKFFQSKAVANGSEYIDANKKRIYFKDGFVGFYFKCKYFRSGFNLAGSYQLYNLRTVISTIEKLNYILPVNESGLRNALHTVKVKGRMETVSENPRIIIDAAHNKQGLENLVKEVRFLNFKRLFLLAGILKDKDYKEYLKIMTKISKKVIIFPPNHERALDIERVRTYIYSVGYRGFDIHTSVDSGFAQILGDYKDGDLILVTGSHFVLSDFLNLLK